MLFCDTEFEYSEQSLDILSLGIGLNLRKTEYKFVHQIIEDFAKTQPKKNAIYCGFTQSEIPYEVLYLWAKDIASRMTANGIGPSHRVIILIDPSMSMIAALLGVMFSGAAYVPLDLNQPEKHIVSVIADAKVSAVLLNTKNKDRFAALGLPLYEIEELPIAYHKMDEDFVNLNASDPAYLIYTSGSTGTPKGVLIGHKELLNSTIARTMVYPGVPRFLLISPIACDSSMAGIWGTLASGGQLIIASKEQIRDPLALISIINVFQITQILCIPSFYGAILDAMQRNFIQMPHLQTVIVAGEVLHQTLIDKHFSMHDHKVELFNEYGPTEATIWASYQKFTSATASCIGGPIPGTRLYVLDENLKLLPIAEKGELYIGGDQLAIGYFEKPTATAEVFLSDPFINNSNARMYKTGDIVCWNRDGTLDYIGRRDQQLKIRGFRVETMAVEVALCALPHISEAVVLPNTDRTSLVAFLVSGGPVNTDNIREKLSNELPAAMVPAQILTMNEFPRTTSGKVDRRQLEDMLAAQSTMNTIDLKNNIDDQKKSECMLTKVSKAWKEILNLSVVPEKVNFFDLGGHSLLIFKLQDALEKNTGIRPSVVSLFRYTTVSEQTQLLQNDTLEQPIENGIILKAALNPARRRIVRNITGKV